jgi:peptidyl-prolyl cis-trans isomerase SurA
MIHRISLYFTAFIAYPLGSWLYAQPAANDLTHLGNGVAAIVEGEIITIEQLRKELEPILPRLQVEAKNQKDFAQRIDALTYEILQTMIDRILIVNAGKEKGILIPDSYIDKEYDQVLEQEFGGNRAQFLEYLKTQGLTPRGYRKIIYDRVVVNVMRQENRKSESEVSPERIEAFYIENKARFYQSEALHLRQIILSSSADTNSADQLVRATEIIHKLEQGARFSDLAREYGQDAVSRKGGDWGWIERKDIRAELSDVAFSLEPGQYSQPIHLANTIFILYAEAVRKEMIQPIAQVRDLIERQLSDQIARENQEKWLQSLRDRAFVRYYL